MRTYWILGLLLLAACSSPGDEPAATDDAYTVMADPAPTPAHTTVQAQATQPVRDAAKPGVQVEKRPRVFPRGYSRDVKILYVEQGFRWQARALNDALKRDRSVAYQAFFLDAQKGWTQPVSQYDEAIKRRLHPLQHPFSFKGAPAETREEFLGMSYDVMLIGDLNPADERIPAYYWDWIDEWVRDGGGLILAAGQHHHPAAYLNNAAFRRLHPFDLNVPEGEIDTRVMKHWGLTTEGRKHGICALSHESNDEAWGGEESGEYKRGLLNGLYWYAQAGNPVSGTTVLARVAREGERISAGAPLLAVREHGRGRVVWIGSDDTHYWREMVGDHYFYRFWQNAIAWAANAEK
jgi:hypothetical protein